MRPVDEPLLEALRDEGSMTPTMMEDRGITEAANYAGERLRKLAEYGMVDRVAYGVYRITEDGEAFLDEEIDAAELDSRRSE